jgi:hypothetical protein
MPTTPDDLTRIIGVVLRDAGGAPVPTVENRQWTDEPSAMLVDPADGTAFGVHATLTDPEPVRVVAVAEQIQEWVLEALWRRGASTNWPECPAHPGNHPLEPVVADRRAVWACPALGSVIADIGSLRSRRSPS